MSNNQVFYLTRSGNYSLTRVIYLNTQLAYLFIPGTTWKARPKRHLLNRKEEAKITLPVDWIDSHYYPNYKEHTITNNIIFSQNEVSYLVDIISGIVSDDYSDVLKALVYTSSWIGTSLKWRGLIFINLSNLIDTIFSKLSLRRGLTYEGVTVFIKNNCQQWSCTAVSLVEFKTHYLLGGT